jgi:hypothetical protein
MRKQSLSFFMDFSQHFTADKCASIFMISPKTISSWTLRKSITALMIFLVIFVALGQFQIPIATIALVVFLLVISVMLTAAVMNCLIIGFSDDGQISDIERK